MSMERCFKDNLLKFCLGSKKSANSNVTSTERRSDRYAAIKKLCIAEKPVASQAINLKTISNEKKATSVVQKIALQINCKLGGEVNVVFSLTPSFYPQSLI